MSLKDKFKDKFLKEIKKDVTKAKKNRDEKKSKINKNAFRWILLFFPYGIYYMFKNKAFKSPIRIAITIFISIIIVGVADFLINPDRVLDDMVNKSVVEYLDKNKDMGTFGFIEKVKRDYKNKNDREYFLYTSKDKYMVCVNQKDRKAELVGIYEVGHEQKTVYQSENFDIPKNINPAVYFFIKDNDYGNVKEVTKTEYPYQNVKTDKGDYRFFCDYGRVDKVYKKEKDKYQIIYKIKNEDIILPEFKKILDKGKYGKVQEIMAYDLEKDGQVEYLKTDKGYFKFKKFFNKEIIVYQH